MNESASDNVPAVLHLTDFHFWEVVFNPLKLLNKRALGNANVYFRRRHHFPMERADAAAEAALHTGVKTFVLGGDFTSTATENEFRRASEFVKRLAEADRQILLMPGNHDVYTFEAARARRFEKHFEAYLPPEGYPARHTLDNGLHVILAPTVCPNLLSSRGRITREEADKVGTLIADAPPGPVLVAGHYPVLHRTYAYDAPRERQLRNADLLRRAMGESGREILYVAGHVHRFSYVQDADYPRLRHVTTPALFMERHGEEARGAFTELRFPGGDPEVVLHRWAETWEQEVVQPHPVG